ncbi:MAG: PrsW family intramembrane metalloprotease [bacterium]|jgi:RsiW-degrading membrane proteinase PrsW (M82 family)|nr:PrsW family intramembrane metalloprotease [bacterium]
MSSSAAMLRGRDALRSSDFFQPHRPAFWLYLALLAPLGALELIQLQSLAVRAGPIPSLVGFGLIVVWVAIFIWFIRRLDLFQRASVSLMVAAFVWGGFIAGNLAGHSNSSLFTSLARANPELQELWGAALIGPTTEEVLKALGVVMVVLIAGRRFHSLMDGFIYGALAGLGFQFTENIQYMFRNGNPLDAGATLQTVLQIFVIRAVILGAFSHATYTALVGFGVGYYVVKREATRLKRLLVPICLFIAAWLFHFLNNAPTAFPVTILIGLIALVLAFWLYDRARRDEYGWFRSVVADDIGTDLITAEEVAALRSLRQRRRARVAVRKAGDRAASRLAGELQRAQITYGRAKDRAVPGWLEVEQARQRIWEIRRLLPALRRPGLEKA